MWVLKSNSRIQAKTLVAVSTALDFTVFYNTKSGNLNHGPYTENGTINNVASDIIPPPSIDRETFIRSITVNNTDNINHTVIFYFNDGVASVIFRALLEPNWTIEWLEETGWQVYDENGNIQNTTNTTRVHNNSNPGAVLTDIFTATSKTTINKIIIANRSAVAKTFRLTISPLGVADAPAHYLFYDISLSKNDTKEINGPFELIATDKIRVYGQDSNVSFTVNGLKEV